MHRGRPVEARKGLGARLCAGLGVLALLLAVLVGAPLVANGMQSSTDSSGSRLVPERQDRTPSAARGVAAVPFGVGERLDYDVRFGSLKVGNGTMEVRGVVDVRGRPTWNTLFTIRGGIPLYRVNDRYESWFDLATLETRRYHQDIDEGNYERKRRYEFFPERGMFQENDRPERPTVKQPLDDGSFLYFVRTLPLEVGAVYNVPRYFNPEANPVTIRVLRRDTVDVPAGRFATVVLQPTFKSRGLFAEGGRAEVWISDDDRRMMVQMKSRLSIGSLNLYLREFTTAAAGFQGPVPPR